MPRFAYNSSRTMQRTGCLLLVIASAAFGQSSNWTLEFANHYAVQANITYLIANNYEDKLDLYERRDAQDAQPTLIYIHGGGWTGGTKEGGFNKVLPYLEMGWNVVNVEYRLARVSQAPAAVEDCLCALRWVAANAKQHHIDVNRLVVTGDSAGGHLALTTGMIPESAGLDRECPGVPCRRLRRLSTGTGSPMLTICSMGRIARLTLSQWLGSSQPRRRLRSGCRRSNMCARDCLRC